MVSWLAKLQAGRIAAGPRSAWVFVWDERWMQWTSGYSGRSGVDAD